MTSWGAALLLAGMAVLLLATAGFNRPTWARTFTTAARYRIAICAHIAIYALVLLVSYAIAGRFIFEPIPHPAPAPEALAALEEENAELRELALWLALLATALLRAFPPFSRTLRNFLHRMCGITGQAGRFAHFLSESVVDAPPELREKAIAMLSHRGVGTEDSWIPAARPVYLRLLRATLLFLRLREWEDGSEARRYARFMREAVNEFDQLRKRYDRLVVRVSRARASMERIGDLKCLHSEHVAGSELDRDDVERFDNHLRRLVSESVTELCEDLTVFHRDACVLAARGVMTEASTRRRRDNAIIRLGFAPSGRETAGTYGTLLHAAVLLYLGVWLFFLILPQQERAIGNGQLVAIITLNVVGSMAIAILPKHRWGFATAGLHPRTPIPFLVSAGFAAVLFATCVNLVAGALIIGGWQGALSRLSEGAPYLPSQFLTAATMVWLTQDHRWIEFRSSRWRRVFDALTLGGVWILTTVIAQLLEGREFATARLVGAFVLGGVIGAAIPGSVRSNVLRPATGFGLPVSDFDVHLATGDAAAQAPEQLVHLQPEQRAAA